MIAILLQSGADACKKQSQMQQYLGGNNRNEKLATLNYARNAQ